MQETVLCLVLSRRTGTLYLKLLRGWTIRSSKANKIENSSENRFLFYIEFSV